MLGKQFLTISTSNINQSLNFRHKLESDENFLSHLENVTKDNVNSKIVKIELLKGCLQSHDGKNYLHFKSDLNAIEVLRHISLLYFYDKKINFIK